MRISLARALALVWLTSGAAVGEQDDSKITPVATIEPRIFPAGQLAKAALCVTNGNPGSRKSIQPGDTFVFQHNQTDLDFSFVGTGPLFLLSTQKTWLSSNFKIHMGDLSLSIVYEGPAAPFPPGDGVCADTLMRIPGQTKWLNIKLSRGFTSNLATPGAFSGNVESRYNEIEPMFIVLASVDFPVGPPGPPGATGSARLGVVIGTGGAGGSPASSIPQKGGDGGDSLLMGLGGMIFSAGGGNGGGAGVDTSLCTGTVVDLGGAGGGGDIRASVKRTGSPGLTSVIRQSLSACNDTRSAPGGAPQILSADPGIGMGGSSGANPNGAGSGATGAGVAGADGYILITW